MEEVDGGQHVGMAAEAFPPVLAKVVGSGFSGSSTINQFFMP